MKRITITLLALMLALICALGTISCEIKENAPAETLADGEVIEAEGIWENATYRTNTEVGRGEKTVVFTVEADGKSVSITLKTDKDNFGDALFAEGLINDASFFNVLNGIEASWEKDQAYWSFYEGDTLLPYGVNEQIINGGESFRFVYTKL